jgi:DNA-binding HxlR family transcriptional regulator
MNQETRSPECCKASIGAVQDALYALNGKWKLLVITSMIEGPRRFKEIERAIEGITPKVLSKELKDLELNEFVERKVYDTIPVQVTYELTPYSESLHEIITALRAWGEQHKKMIVKKRKEALAARAAEQM